MGVAQKRRRRKVSPFVNSNLKIWPRQHRRPERQYKLRLHGDSCMKLSDVKKFQITSSDIHETVVAIRDAGKAGYELFVLWSGIVDESTFVVKKVHVPRQESHITENGLYVIVSGDELRSISMELYETGQILGAQVHSHPDKAYHSEMDDTYPMVATGGALSIVLPFFGRHGFRAKGIATYRLRKEGWVRLHKPINSVLDIIDDGNI